MLKLHLNIFFCLFFFLQVMSVAQTESPKVEHYTTRNGIASNVVNSILQDNRGYIWLGTSAGLSRFDGYRFVNFYVDSVGIESIVGITEDKDGQRLLMRGNDYRPLCFDLRQLRFVSADSIDIPSDIVLDEERVYMRRALSLGVKSNNMTGRHHHIRYARLDDGKEVYITTDNGFFLFDPADGQLRHFSATDQHPIVHSDYLNDIMKDRIGNLWIATSFAGLYQLTFGEEHLHTYSMGDGMVKSVRSFSPAFSLENGKLTKSASEIIVTAMDGSVMRYDLKTQQYSNIVQLDHRVYVTRTDRRGRLWMGTRGDGVWVVDKGKMQHIEALPARNVYDIIFDYAHNRIWIGTLDKGLIEIRGNIDEISGLKFKGYIENERVHQLCVDRKGRLWIASENGVLMKDNDSCRFVYRGCKAVCVACTEGNAIVAGTSDQGLLRIENGNVTRMGTAEGLANNSVMSVAVSTHGIIVCGTEEGVSVVNEKLGTIQNFYSSFGIMGDVYNENAIMLSSNGGVLLGNIHGLVELDGETIRKTYSSQDIRPAIITCVDINDIPFYQGEYTSLQLEHDKNNLTFYFSALDYRANSSVVYSYWLENTRIGSKADREWRMSTKDHKAIYNNLTPGRYRFHVRASIDGKQWSEESVCVVNVLQPWWWTWWMRLIYILVIAIFVWYEWHQYQQRISLRRQLDQRLTTLYARPVTQADSHIQADSRVKESVDADSGSMESSSQDECDNAGVAEQKASGIDEADNDESANVQEGESKNHSSLLNKLDVIIQDNLQQADIDIAFLATQMCMSHSTLYRRIKTLTGMTVNEYVRRHRLAKAMQLLRDGSNVTETASMCGFSSPNYFSRCFKTEYGISPSEIK